MIIFDTEKTGITKKGCCEVPLCYPLYVSHINQTLNQCNRKIAKKIYCLLTAESRQLKNNAKQREWRGERYPSPLCRHILSHSLQRNHWKETKDGMRPIIFLLAFTRLPFHITVNFVCWSSHCFVQRNINFWCCI